jgi:tetratricopeptide (TPR) repeat protein
MRVRWLCTLILSLVFALLCQSQTRRGGGSPLPNPGMPEAGQLEGVEIQVHVTWENERPTGEVLHLQLLNQSEMAIQNTFTDKNGLAVFRNCRQGDYRIKVDGPKVATAITPWIRIMQSQGMHQEYVHVVPADPNLTPGQQPGVPGGVDSEATVPEKAKKEVDKGMESMDKNELDKAMGHFQKAIEIYPKYARAWNNIGVIKGKNGDRAGAKEAWQKAIEADEKFSGAYFNLARISIAEKQPAEAEQLLAKGLATAPKSAEGLFLLASAQYMQGHFDESLNTAKKVHALEHKQYADIHVVAAQAYVKAGQDKLAVGEYETYLTEYPNSPKAAQIRQSMAQLQAKSQ